MHAGNTAGAPTGHSAAEADAGARGGGRGGGLVTWTSPAVFGLENQFFVCKRFGDWPGEAAFVQL